MKAFFVVFGWIFASQYFWKRVLLFFANILTLLTMWVWFLPYLLLYMIFLQPKYGKNIFLGKEFLLDDLLIGFYLESGFLCFVLNWLILFTMPVVAPVYFIIDMIQQQKCDCFYNVFTGKEYILDI